MDEVILSQTERLERQIQALSTLVENLSVLNAELTTQLAEIKAARSEQQQIPMVLHESSQAVVNHLFPRPSHYGRRFPTLFLAHATAAREQGRRVAVISVQRIHDLAPLIGWSYESTHKYVVLYCALEMLRRERRSGKVVLIMDLERYRPPSTMQALSHLITDCRYKVQRTATAVRERWVETGLPV
jgi:hypothetical protein